MSPNTAVAAATPATLLAVAQASPDAVAIHDRAAWIALFAADGLVNDPVGSIPHVGHAALGRFYDAFIAPNQIRFLVDHDIVCGDVVVRDVTIETRMGSGVVLHVPAHLRYGIVATGRIGAVAYMRAHWEMLPMVRQLYKTGPKGVWTSLSLGWRLLRHLGLGGMLGFMRGAVGIGRKGKAAVVALAAERGWALTKILAAGNSVTATATWDDHGTRRRGVLLVEFAHGRIANVTLFA